MVYVKLRDYFKILYYSVLKNSRGKATRAFFGGRDALTPCIYICVDITQIYSSDCVTSLRAYDVYFDFLFFNDIFHIINCNLLT